MKRKSIQPLFFIGILLLLLLTYTKLTLITLGTPFLTTTDVPVSTINNSTSAHFNYIGITKIVGFCNYNYRSVAKKWYERLSRLGYTTHVLVATDEKMKTYLESKSFRFEVALADPIPSTFDGKRKTKRDRAELELLFAVRWKYLLSQLERGTNILLTDVDNIFSKFVKMKDEVEDPDVDVWFAYATKYPNKVFMQQGFTVCGGMSWWRASRGAVDFVRFMHGTCGIMCDDQRLLNNLLLQVNMTWDWTPTVLNSRIQDGDERFVGLPSLGLTGSSARFGFKARIWDRDVAYRGLLQPQECPKNNWISMPIVDAKSRYQNWMAKLDSFDIWDQHCGTSA